MQSSDRRTLLLAGLAPVLVVAGMVALVALPELPEVAKALCFLLVFPVGMVGPPALYAWSMLRTGRPPQAMTELQARFGGEITMPRLVFVQPTLRTRVDGAHVEVRYLRVRTGYKRMGWLLRISTSEGAAPHLIGVTPPPLLKPARFLLVELGIEPLDTNELTVTGRPERFVWFTDQPEAARALLRDEGVLVAWLELLTVNGDGATALSVGPAGSRCGIRSPDLDGQAIERVVHRMLALARATRARNAEPGS